MKNTVRTNNELNNSKLLESKIEKLQKENKRLKQQLQYNKKVVTVLEKLSDNNLGRLKDSLKIIDQLGFVIRETQILNEHKSRAEALQQKTNLLIQGKTN